MNLTKLNLVFLSGAGAVGKTCVAQELLKLSTPGTPIRVVPSTTRASYAKLGIESERATTGMVPEMLMRLQKQIFKDYADSLLANLDAAINENVKVLVVDRSPFDHASYYLNCLPSLTMEEIEEYLQLVDLVFDGVVSNPMAVTSVWFFKYPTSWTSKTATEDSDLFRRAPAGKNLVWSMTLESMLNEVVTRRGDLFKFDITDQNHASPEARAKMIMHKLAYIRRVR